MTLELGRHSYGSIHIHNWSRPNVIIKTGKYCSFASDIHIFIDGNHRMDTFSTYPFHRLYPEIKANNYGKETPTIGNDVWIANNVTIYSGIHIGDGAVIAGQSVVTKSVPPYAIVGGNPAKIIRYRFSPEIISEFLTLKWWDLPDDIIRKRLLPLTEDIEKMIEQLKLIRSGQNS